MDLVAGIPKRKLPAKQCGLSGKELVNESVIPERATWVNKNKKPSCAEGKRKEVCRYKDRDQDRDEDEDEDNDTVRDKDKDDDKDGNIDCVKVGDEDNVKRWGWCRVSVRDRDKDTQSDSERA